MVPTLSKGEACRVRCQFRSKSAPTYGIPARHPSLDQVVVVVRYTRREFGVEEAGLREQEPLRRRRGRRHGLQKEDPIGKRVD